MSKNIIEMYYDAFNKKDLNTILSICTEDVINDLNQGDSQYGKDKLKLFFETIWSHFDEVVSNIEFMVNVDESKIASEYLVKGRYYKTKEGLFAANNQPYDIVCVAIFTIKNNKIARITRYYNVKKWLEIVNPENK